MKLLHNIVILMSCLFCCSLSLAQEVPVFDFDGMIEQFERKANTVYVVNFWATWCKPCVKELPYFNEVYEMPLENVEVRLVSLDMPDQKESRLYKFLESTEVLPEVWLMDDPDANRWIDLIDPSWSGAIPATVFYYNDKKLFKEGTFANKEEILNYIRKIKT